MKGSVGYDEDNESWLINFFNSVIHIIMKTTQEPNTKLRWSTLNNSTAILAYKWKDEWFKNSFAWNFLKISIFHYPTLKYQLRYLLITLLLCILYFIKSLINEITYIIKMNHPRIHIQTFSHLLHTVSAFQGLI